MDAEQKKVFVTCPFFYFTKQDYKVLQPLDKADLFGEDGPEWKQAYQAVKHDRINNLKLGKVGNLINAMAALFILNVYYRDAKFYTEEDYQASKIDWGLGSEIFAVKVSKEERHPSSKAPYVKKWDYEECIYLVKTTDGTGSQYVNLCF